MPQPRTARLILASVCAAIFLGALDLTVATAILPRILVDLEVSIDTDLGRASWIITGYLLAYTIGMSFAGRLSDLYGRRVGYISGLLIFIGGSICAALAPALEWLIAARLIQALGAGALVPIAMALTSDIFPSSTRAQALGIVAAVDTAGWMVGHLYGGALMRLFDNWRLLFWLNVPLGLVALALTLNGVAGLQMTKQPGRFDWRGALLLAAALAALNIGLGGGAELGTSDFYGERSGPPAYTIPLIIVALLLFAAFVWVERRSMDPLIDVGILAERSALSASILNLLSGFGLAIALAAVPLLINARISLLAMGDADALRHAAWDSGILLSALTLSMAAAAYPGGILAGRYGARLPAMVGMAFGLAGFLLCTTWQADTGYLTMALCLAIAGLGLGLGLAPSADLLISRFGEARRGTGAALTIIARLIGMTLGISALTVWGVQRQDTLRRLGESDPLALADPARFLLGIIAQVVAEGMRFAAFACVLGLVAAWGMRALPTNGKKTKATQSHRDSNV